MIATCFALVGFAGSVVVGVASGNAITLVLWRGLAVMAVCFVIGSVVGYVLQKTVDLHIERHKQRNPIPGESASETISPTAAAPAKRPPAAA